MKVFEDLMTPRKNPAMVRPTLPVFYDETPRQEFKPSITIENRHSERFVRLREFIKEQSDSPLKEVPLETPDNSENYRSNRQTPWT